MKEDKESRTTKSEKVARQPGNSRGMRSRLDGELVAGALAEMGGNISAVARRFEVSRQRVHELIAKRPSLQRVVHDAKETALDNAESALMRAVINGEAWAICFFLKTQGRQRGYLERHDIHQETKLTLSVAEELSDDQLAQIVVRDIGAGGGRASPASEGTQGLIELRPIHDA